MTLKAKILLLNLIGLISLFSKTVAQTDTTKNNIVGGFITVPIEFPVIDITDFKQQLNNNGFPSSNYPTANLGIGLQGYSDRFIITFSFNKSTNTKDYDTCFTKIEYRSTSFNLGFDLIKNQSFSIYPYAGFKGSGLNYLYKEKISNSTSFGNYFQTNLNWKEVTNSRFHFDLGIGLSYQSFYLINLRFGYLLPLEKIRWNMNDNQTLLTNYPTISYNYYFILTVGLGNIISDKDWRNRRVPV